MAQPAIRGSGSPVDSFCPDLSMGVPAGVGKKGSGLLDPFLLPAHIQTCSFSSPACLTKPSVLLLPFLSLHSQPGVPVSSLTAPHSHPTPQLISPQACFLSPALLCTSLHCLLHLPWVPLDPFILITRKLLPFHLIFFLKGERKK